MTNSRATGGQPKIPGYVFTEEAAKQLNRHPDTVLRLAREGKIPGAVFVQGYLFPEDVSEEDILYATPGRAYGGRPKKTKTEIGREEKL